MERIQLQAGIESILMKLSRGGGKGYGWNSSFMETEGMDFT